MLSHQMSQSKNDQKSEAFWKNVMQRFIETGGFSERTWKTLRDKFNDMNKSVSGFSNLYFQVCSRDDMVDCTEEEKMRETYALYQTNCGAAFELMIVWEFWRSCDKWRHLQMNYSSIQKKRPSDSVSPTSVMITAAPLSMISHRFYFH